MRLENLLDHPHELYRLRDHIDWASDEEAFGGLYSEEGRPGIAIRLMVGLHYLKHAFNESDERVVARWKENPYWQYFCGEEFFQHRLPINPSQMTRFRQRIGELGCEFMLALTIRTAVQTQVVSSASLSIVTTRRLRLTEQRCAAAQNLHVLSCTLQFFATVRPTLSALVTVMQEV